MTHHVIKRLPVDTGVSGWEAISERAFPVTALEHDITADWLIVGGGFAGLSAARRLSQLRPEDKIVVLEAREIAKGPAGRNSGFMIDVPHNLSSGEYSVADEEATKDEIRQNRLAISFAADVAAEYGLSRETFDPSGKVNAAASERGLGLNDNYRKSLEKIGEEHRVLDADQMREMTGSRYYRGGLYTPGAVMIQPANYIRGLAHGLSSKVAIHEHSPVLELSREGRSWKANTGRGSVSAPKVILAVNGHIQSFGHFRGRLMHVFTYASMTSAFSQNEFGDDVTGADRWALLPADPMGATVRKITTDGRSRIVIRTRFTYDPSLQVSEKRVAGVAVEQRRSFDARFPGLESLPMEYSWAGALCLSRNHVPAFGEVEEGLFSACCENGLGTVKSTLAGMMAADLAAGVGSPELDRYRNQPEPSKIPPEPFAWLGVNSVIRFQELRAGREG
ncbi:MULTISPECIES: NAD(P)/FAD-dependent oxidoreductase [Rhizobium]|uniref:NAD(P)/FAD-dependent oxidoreductase n=1 Tax=Rhizobium TaxID=379 RepID=UPI001A91FABC|nr:MULTISPECIES: FAD-binding oxidoreductase [Rhizobium]MBY3118596.1 FAD-binding oxidoreductase [Rhizobium laguerreae]MBY3131111.1 FAD-binding oxidoreductase [Rhizobium laguerreae]MBY3158541.1 FAD-binding oxidoreductase [Rhizobium laguerreae]MBY3169458.1 FAD-binding oxidoreductase [Rhizobium laguerreae]MBY3174373.1 FAD-binding oxidoreductase [Rhizobium leguminosarum]